MDFNVLDQGFFQNHELELSDVLINTRATLVQLQWDQGIGPSNTSSSLAPVHAQLLPIAEVYLTREIFPRQALKKS